MTFQAMLKNGWRIGLALLALAVDAGAESRTRTRVTDGTTVRQSRPDVEVTTTTRETEVRTTRDHGQWESVTAGTRDRTTRTDWEGDWTDTGYETEAGLETDHRVRTVSKVGNSPSSDIGKTTLAKPERVWEGEIGPEYRKVVRGDLGRVTTTARAGAEGMVREGENGYEARGQVGVEAEVRALSRRFAAGGKNLGASLQGSARLEVSAIAKGHLGAYVDDKGITFGAEGSAGVYAKGEVKLNMEAHVFGVRTNVNLIASGYAGALAEGKAMVTLGWNGKISFAASLGASLGFGGGVAVEFEMDAEELMKRLNFTDITQLLAWLKEFQENPMPVLTKMGIQALRKLHEAGFATLQKLGTQAVTALQHHVLKPIQVAGTRLAGGLNQGLAFLGRVIRSPRSEAGLESVNDCLDQAAQDVAGLDGISAGCSALEFPLCMTDGGDPYAMGDWEGFDPYSWYRFDWPQPYQWPKL